MIADFPADNPDDVYDADDDDVSEASDPSNIN